MCPTWFSGVFCSYKTPTKTINYVSFPISGVLTGVDKRASIARRNDRNYQNHFIGCHQQYSNAPFVLSFKSLNGEIILKRWTCPYPRTQEPGSSVAIKDPPSTRPQRPQLSGLDTVRGIDNRGIGSIPSQGQRCQGGEPDGTGIAGSHCYRGH